MNGIFDYPSFECGAVERKYLKYYDCWIAGGRKDGRKDLPRPFEYYFFLKALRGRRG